jgi:hypothetical protein
MSARKSKKSKASLPRVTLMAYSRRDLVRFCESVERLSLLVLDLQAGQARLEVQISRLQGVSGKKRPQIAKGTSDESQIL